MTDCPVARAVEWPANPRRVRRHRKPVKQSTTMQILPCSKTFNETFNDLFNSRVGGVCVPS
jgi:hypothetical protein